MTTTVNLRKTLHRKAWEMLTPMLGPQAATNTVSGSFIAADNDGLMPEARHAYYVGGASVIYQYNSEQDAWQQIKNSGIAGAFAAGACGEFRAIGYGGTAGDLLSFSATGGTVNSLTTAKAFVRNLAGHKIKVIAGTGVGYEGTIVRNANSTNGVLEVSPDSAVAFDATTRFRMWSGSLWFFNAGTTAVGFSVYDMATDTWTALSVTGLPTAWGTCGQLISTGSAAGEFFTGTAIAGSTTTTLNTALTIPVNSVTNYQVRIKSGTGAGQIRRIASNTVGPNAVLTVSVAWTVTPDDTSVFAIEGCDDLMYLLGNNAVTMYRYDVAANTWATLAPGVARGAAMGGGGCADWVGYINDADWSDQTASKRMVQSWGTMPKQNGRYILSFRGAGSSQIDIYDIALNAWANLAAAYGFAGETFTTGSCSVASGNYIFIQKEATGRIFRFDLTKMLMEPWAANPYPHSTTIEGDKMFVSTYKDGATSVKWLYTQNHTSPVLQRVLMID